MRFRRNGANLMVLVLSVFAVFTLVLFPLSRSAVAKVYGKSLKIGVLTTATGFEAGHSIEGLPGLKVAEEEIASQGGVDGVPLEFIVYDTATNPQQAIQMMQKLVYTDKVLTVIGPHTSGECEVVFPIAVRAKISVVGLLSASPGLSARFRPWAFRNTLTSEKIYNPLIKKWSEQEHVKTAAIIYDKKSPFTKADGEKTFPAALNAAGLKLVGTVEYLTGDTDFSAQITKIKMWKPDGLVLAAYNIEAAMIVKEAKKQGLKVAVVGGLDCMAPNFVRLGGSATEGVWTAHSFYPDNPDPKFQSVMKKAQSILGNKGEASAITARYYDDAMVDYYLIKKMGVTNRPEDLDSDREKIRKGWETLKDFPGVEGKITMNKDGDGEKSTYFFVIKGGKYVRVE